MTSIADFVPFVAVKVARDMPTENIQHALREVIIYFLEQTHAATAETFTRVDSADYEAFLDLPECRRMVAVEGVFLVPEHCGDDRRQMRWRPDWEEIPFSSYKGQPGWSIDDGDGARTTLWIAPLERRTRRLCVRYSWAPKRDAACEVPDWLFERHASAIADGALSYLHNNAADETGSPRFAALMSRAFSTAIDDQKRDRAMQHGPRQMLITSARFFGG